LESERERHRVVAIVEGQEESVAFGSQFPAEVLQGQGAHHVVVCLVRRERERGRDRGQAKLKENEDKVPTKT